jgi:X-X-X-Leu-X-X-Gly heptad repeat protein
MSPMTQPGIPATQTNYTTLVVPCPDGQHRVALQIASGNIQTMLLLDADQADTFADQLAAGLHQAAAQAAQANTGIVLPGGGRLLIPTPQPNDDPEAGTEP